jgi:hypothetical protein
MDTSGQITARAAVLVQMGAAASGSIFQWPTITAVLDHGALLIASDREPAPDDMDALVTLLELSGYDNGSGGPFATDPGEPELDALTGVCTWNLALTPGTEVI